MSSKLSSFVKKVSDDLMGKTSTSKYILETIKLINIVKEKMTTVSNLLESLHQDDVLELNRRLKKDDEFLSNLISKVYGDLEQAQPIKLDK